ncbi:MAG TPA: serine hydrolase domain-containing protein [Rhodopseudomonas sp.]|uniref:serine hydrolase domain-containing protein n=1 Tax=Rhodopseudomonas sp. TaxID=1078 RepID=UPI002ED8EA3B
MTSPATLQPATRPASPTPPLPHGKPDALGLSSHRLRKMSDAFKREIDKGSIPGVTVLIARRGEVGWFEALGRQSPAAAQPMTQDSIFRIFSMTKPIVSIAAMQLVEDGLLLLDDALAKFIPEFADQKVGIARGDEFDLVAPTRAITIQDLLRHTSGIGYEHIGTGPIQKQYLEAKLGDRKLSNADHARLVAGLPLLCQPGSAFNYSRSTDILGRVLEVITGQALGTVLQQRVLAPLQMNETAFHTGPENAGRLAEPFATDPWSGEPVQLFNMLERPTMQSGGGGLTSTTMDYARFCQMLLNGGTLDGTRIIGRKTLQLMASNHLGRHVPTDRYILPPGHGFGLGFAVRTDQGLAPFAGSVGQFFWSGIAGTFFWIDPQEELFAVFMSQGPGQREYFRNLVRSLVYAALE